MYYLNISIKTCYLTFLEVLDLMSLDSEVFGLDTDVVSTISNQLYVRIDDLLATTQDSVTNVITDLKTIYNLKDKIVEEYQYFLRKKGLKGVKQRTNLPRTVYLDPIKLNSVKSEIERLIGERYRIAARDLFLAESFASSPPLEDFKNNTLVNPYLPIDPVADQKIVIRATKQYAEVNTSGVKGRVRVQGTCVPIQVAGRKIEQTLYSKKIGKNKFAVGCRPDL